VIGEPPPERPTTLPGPPSWLSRWSENGDCRALVGPIGYGSDQPSYLSGPPLGQERPYAEGTQQVIDQEVGRLLSEAEDRARGLLSDNRNALDAVIAALLEKETISGEDLTDVVRQVRSAGEGSQSGVHAPSTNSRTGLHR
jgi:cell division protease FtsH